MSLFRSIATLKRDIKLFIERPREFLYSFTLSSQKLYSVVPFDPQVKAEAEQLLQQIRTSFPELSVHLVGSIAFEISGKNDVDIIIDCEPERFDRYVPYFTVLFGVPTSVKSWEVKWSTSFGLMQLDAMLIDPTHVVRKTLLETFKILINNPAYIREYAALKLGAHGVSLREYQRRRMVFFNRILKTQLDKE